jgi:prepilin-type N-terminal cleavage/methylation domain-containing protein
VSSLATLACVSGIDAIDAIDAIDTMKNGFTLVELLVVIGLVLIIGTVGTNVITSILRSYNKAHIINEVEQNGNYVLSLMENQIRNAKSVAASDCTGNNCSTLRVTPQGGSSYNFEIKTETVAGGTVGVVKKGGEVLTNYSNDLKTGVNVDTDRSRSYFEVGSTNPPTVKIVLRLTQAPNAPGRVDYQAETTLRTTVVVRGGYE